MHDSHLYRRGIERINVGPPERAVSAMLGLAMIALGIRHGRASGLLTALAGAGLTQRGVSGHCAVYERLGVTSAHHHSAEPRDYFERGIHVDESITIQRPIGDVYAFWHHLSNLAMFMDHVERVDVLDERRSHWAVRGPAGKIVEWDAEIINEEPDRLISWKSLEGAEVDNTGTVTFREAPGGRGTEVHVVLDYLPPAGRVGATIAKLMGQSPGRQIRADLRCLRQILETGEAATTEGQSSGRTGGTPRLKGRAMAAAVAGAGRIMASSDQPTRSYARRAQRTKKFHGASGEELRVGAFEAEGGGTAPGAQQGSASPRTAQEEGTT